MGQQAFEGLKVCDLTQAAAAPIAVRLLADHGATVIHVESMKRIDMARVTLPFKDHKPGINRGLSFSNYECNKFGITLNLKHPRGPEIAKRLIAWSDVVVENYTPGVVESYGLGYEGIVRIKADIIMLRISNQGQTGPWKNFRGYGPHVTAQCGFPLILGWPDREPSFPLGGFYPDIIASRWASIALLAALDHRRRTGEGQILDLSMVEAGLSFMALPILDYNVNGRDLTRMGNRSLYAAPHGAYPCLGDDAWCVISILDDNQWRRFCETIGSPPWAMAPEFTTLSGRKENEDELDSLIGEWTSRLNAEEVMNILQKAGLAAGVVKNMAGICQDPQLEHRGHFRRVDHPEIGPHSVDGWSFKLSRCPYESRRAGPCLGQDNDYVYTKILGMSDDEFVELHAEGVFE